MDTSGFYKFQDELMWAPNGVYAPSYTLERENKDALTYPIDGWTWFDSEQLARQAFGLPELEQNG